MRTVIGALAVVCAICCLGGCANVPKQESGTGVGAVIGGVLGAVLGRSSDSRAAGAAIGAAIGAVIGRAVGEHLDEVERMKAQVATMAALKQPTNSTVSWTSDKNPGVGGVVKTSTPVVAATAPVATGQGECKQVTHIININGREQKEEGRWCRRSDGSWASA